MIDQLKKLVLKFPENVRDRVQINASFLALPLMLRDAYDDIFVKFGDEGRCRTPRIVAVFTDFDNLLCASEYHVMVESETVAHTDDFFVAFVLLFSSFNNFNLEYPNSVSATFSYF